MPLNHKLMKTFFTLLTVAIAIVSCTKAPDPVTEPKRYECKGVLTFRKDTTLVPIDTLDNTYFAKDITVGNPNPAGRMDIRIVEKKTGNTFVLTLRDFTNEQYPTPGFYVAQGVRKAEMYYYLPEYKSSLYLIDSLSVNLMNFDATAETASGKFAARMIDSTNKDTIRLRLGDFQSICVKPRN